MSASILIVPGFMSPAWMLRPLASRLRGTYPSVVLWDYPRVFADVELNLAELSAQLDHTNPHIVITHSYGDWMARAALGISEYRPQGMIAISPVVRSVPLIRALPNWLERNVPEFVVMRNEQRAAVNLQPAMEQRRMIYWARGELLVDPNLPEHHRCRRQRFFWGTHNSLLFQPKVWAAIDQDIADLQANQS